MTALRLAQVLLLAFALTLATAARPAYGASEPFLVETKVQADLEAQLSKLIPVEQFLVQVTGEVSIKTERKIIEGEILSTDVIEQKKTVQPAPPMPGFVPELEEDEESSVDRLPKQNRQSYRVVETPYLSALRVRASFDEKLPANTVTRAKDLITGYLRSHYPNKAFITFLVLPMLKPAKVAGAEDENNKKKPEPPAKTEAAFAEEQFWIQAKWAMWTALALLALIFLGRNSAKRAEAKSLGGFPPPPVFNLGGIGESLGLGGGNRAPDRSVPASAAVSPAQLAGAYQRRKKLLDKILSRSEAFRLYYDRLTNEDRDALYTALKGPAFDSLLDGLGYKRPLISEDPDPNTLEDQIAVHEKNFDEFVQAKEWQERQFFGFLGQLSTDQLQALSNHQPARILCLMLRFMKPHQSASILDRLPPIKRREVLSYSQEIAQLPLADLIAIEKDIRTAAGRMPQQMFATEREDSEYWGSVLAESTQQDTLFEDMEKTNPGLSSGLKKFKFRLEDAATLPDNLLAKVLGKVDNEELCLALATCKEDVAEVILDALSALRRETILKQMPSYKGAAQDQAAAARVSLTRRFREAMA